MAIAQDVVAVSDLLCRQRLVVQTPDSTPASIEAALGNLSDRVASVHVESRHPEMVALFTALLERQAVDPNVPPIAGCRFSLEGLLGITMPLASSAVVSLRGTMSFPVRTTPIVGPGVTTPDGWEVNPAQIYNVALTLEPAGWRISNLTETRLDGGPIN